MFADIPGARIWYEDTGGHGAAVVLLHAGTGSTLMWERQLPALREAGLRAIAYDRRGHGRTESESCDVPAVDDLRGLANRLGLARFHLVGTAAGGIVAFDFALSHPDRLLTLTVANSIGGMQDEEYLALQRRLRPSPQFDALPAEVRELGPAYRAADSEGTRRWIELEHASRRAGEKKQPPRNTLKFAALEAIRVPTLLITGDADLYTPPPVLELFRRRIAGSTSVVLQNCGHSAYWEQAEVFNSTLLDFLSGAARSP